MNDNIQVAIRVRELIQKEKQAGLKSNWRIDGNSLVAAEETGRKPIVYTFDHIFDETSVTLDVFNTTCKQIVDASMNGFNGTIFAYGQSSSGKTHTITGSLLHPGIIPLAVDEIFNQIANIRDMEYLIRVSYMEIYNEKLTDLLKDDDTSLKLQEDTDKTIRIAGLHEEMVHEPSVVTNILKIGNAKRHTSATKQNDRSSRSHCILRFVVESRVVAEEDNAVKVSHLYFVDLAGSEKAGENQGDRFREGCSINKSLFTLGNVIRKLSGDDNFQFASYRDSKLTRILQNSLGGNSKTAIICTITPAHIEESESTLKFASRAKTITNSAHVNEVLSEAALLKKYQKKINALEKKVREGSNDGHLVRQIEENVAILNEQEETIKNLKKMILISGSVKTDEPPAKKRRRETWAPGKRGKPRLSIMPSASNFGMVSTFNADDAIIEEEEQPTGLLSQSAISGIMNDDIFDSEMQAVRFENDFPNDTLQLNQVKELFDLQDKHEILLEEFEKKQNELNELQEFTELERQTLEETIQELTKELKDEKSKDWAGGQQWMEEELMKAQQERNSLRLKVDSLNRQIKSAEAGTGLSAKCDQLSASEKTVEQLNSDMDIQKNRYEFHIDQMKAKMESYTKMLDEKGVDSDFIKQRLLSETDQIVELKTSHEVKVNDLQNEIDMLVLSLEKAETNYKKLDAEYDAAFQDQKERFQKDIQERDVEIEIYMDLLKKETASNAGKDSSNHTTEFKEMHSDLQSNLKAKADKIKEMQEEIKHWKQKYESLFEEHNQQILKNTHGSGNIHIEMIDEIRDDEIRELKLKNDTLMEELNHKKSRTTNNDFDSTDNKEEMVEMRVNYEGQLETLNFLLQEKEKELLAYKVDQESGVSYKQELELVKEQMDNIKKENENDLLNQKEMFERLLSESSNKTVAGCDEQSVAFGTESLKAEIEELKKKYEEQIQALKDQHEMKQRAGINDESVEIHSKVDQTSLLTKNTSDDMDKKCEVALNNSNSLEIEMLKAEMEKMRQSYEDKMNELTDISFTKQNDNMDDLHAEMLKVEMEEMKVKHKEQIEELNETHEQALAESVLGQSDNQGEHIDNIKLEMIREEMETMKQLYEQKISEMAEEKIEIETLNGPEYLQQVETLKQQIETMKQEYEGEIFSLKETIEKLVSENDDNNRKGDKVALDNGNNCNSLEIEMLKAEMEEMRQNYEDKMKEQTEVSFNKQNDNMDDLHTELLKVQMEEMKVKHKDQIEELNETHKQALAESILGLSENHEEHEDNIKLEMMREEIETMKQSYEQKISEMAEEKRERETLNGHEYLQQVETLKQEFETMKQKYECEIISLKETNEKLVFENDDNNRKGDKVALDNGNSGNSLEIEMLKAEMEEMRQNYEDKMKEQTDISFAKQNDNMDDLHAEMLKVQMEEMKVTHKEQIEELNETHEQALAESILGLSDNQEEHKDNIKLEMIREEMETMKQSYEQKLSEMAEEKRERETVSGPEYLQQVETLKQQIETMKQEYEVEIFNLKETIEKLISENDDNNRKGDKVALDNSNSLEIEIIKAEMEEMKQNYEDKMKELTDISFTKQNDNMDDLHAEMLKIEMEEMKVTHKEQIDKLNEKYEQALAESVLCQSENQDEHKDNIKLEMMREEMETMKQSYEQKLSEMAEEKRERETLNGPEYLQQVETLKQQIETMKQEYEVEIFSLKETIEKLISENDEIDRKGDNGYSDNSLEIEMLKAEMEEMRQSYEDKMKEQTEVSFNKQNDNMDDLHTELLKVQMEEMKVKHKEQIEELNETHEQALAESILGLSDNQEEHKDNIKLEMMREEMETMKQSYEQKISEIAEEVVKARELNDNDSIMISYQDRIKQLEEENNLLVETSIQNSDDLPTENKNAFDVLKAEMEEMKVDYEIKLMELNEQLETLKTENSGQCMECCKEREKFDETRTLYENTIKDLEDEMMSFKASINQLPEDIEKLNQVIKTLKKEKIELLNNKAELEENFEVCTEALEELKKALNESETENETLRGTATENVSLKDRIQQLGEEIESGREVVSDYQVQVEALEDELNIRLKNMNDMFSRDDVKKMEEEFSDRLSCVENEKTKLKNEMKALTQIKESEKKALKDKLEQVEGESEITKQVLCEKQTQIDELKNELSACLERLKNRISVDEVKKMEVELGERLKCIENEKTKLQNDIQTLTEMKELEILSLNDKLESINETISIKDAEIMTLKDALDKSNEKVCKTQTLSEELNKETEMLKVKDSTIQSLMQELEKASEIQVDQDMEILALKEKLRNVVEPTVNKETVEPTDNRETIEERIRVLETESAELRLKIQELEKEKRENQQTIESLKEDNFVLEQNLPPETLRYQSLPQNVDWENKWDEFVREERRKRKLITIQHRLLNERFESIRQEAFTNMEDTVKISQLTQEITALKLKIASLEAKPKAKVQSAFVADMDHSCKYRQDNTRLVLEMETMKGELDSKTERLEEDSNSYKQQISRLKNEIRRLGETEKTCDFSHMKQPRFTEEEPPVDSTPTHSQPEATGTNAGMVDHFRVRLVQAKSEQMKKELDKARKEILRLEKWKKEQTTNRSRIESSSIIMTQEEHSLSKISKDTSISTPPRHALEQIGGVTKNAVSQADTSKQEGDMKFDLSEFETVSEKETFYKKRTAVQEDANPDKCNPS